MDEWRERVGEEEADRARTRATSVGTSAHSFMECILSKDAVYTPPHDEYTQVTLQHQAQLSAELLPHLTAVYATELTCFYGGLGGTCDLVCNYDGIPTIIDYKTKRRPMTDQARGRYFRQLAFYYLAIKSEFKLPIERGYIIESVEGEGVDSHEVYLEEYAEYFKELKKESKSLSHECLKWKYSPTDVKVINPRMHKG